MSGSMSSISLYMKLNMSGYNVQPILWEEKTIIFGPK